MELQCEKHPNYKGLSDTKRDCPTCKAIRAQILQHKQAQRDKGRGSYVSPSTPGYRCGLLHVMAELGTLMFFGPQPAFFWRETSGASPKVRDYFKSRIKSLSFWRTRNPEVLRNVSLVLWEVFGRQWESESATRLRNEYRVAKQRDESLESTTEETEEVDEARRVLEEMSQDTEVLSPWSM